VLKVHTRAVAKCNSALQDPSEDSDDFRPYQEIHINYVQDAYEKQPVRPDYVIALFSNILKTVDI
jgi:hypothetical protein